METTPEAPDEEEFGEKSATLYVSGHLRLITCSGSDSNSNLNVMQEVDVVFTPDSLGDTISVDRQDSTLNEFDVDENPNEVSWAWFLNYQ